MVQTCYFFLVDLASSVLADLFIWNGEKGWRSCTIIASLDTVMTIVYDIAKKNLRQWMYDKEHQIEHSIISTDVFLNSQVTIYKTVRYFNQSIILYQNSKDIGDFYAANVYACKLGFQKIPDNKCLCQCTSEAFKTIASMLPYCQSYQYLQHKFITPSLAQYLNVTYPFILEIPFSQQFTHIPLNI